VCDATVELSCDTQHLAERRRFNRKHESAVHLGLLVSVDRVIELGTFRDQAARETKAIPFERREALESGKAFPKCWLSRACVSTRIAVRIRVDNDMRLLLRPRAPRRFLIDY